MRHTTQVYSFRPTGTWRATEHKLVIKITSTFCQQLRYCWSTWRGLSKRWEQSFQQGLLRGTKGDGFRPKEGRFSLDMRKKFSAMRVAKPWCRLPREVVEGPFLETFKSVWTLGLWGTCCSWGCLSALQQGWNGWPSKPQPKPLYDSVKWNHK